MVIAANAPRLLGFRANQAILDIAMLEWETGDDGWDDTTDEWGPSCAEPLASSRREETPQSADRRPPTTLRQGSGRHRRVVFLVIAAGAAVKRKASCNLAAVKAEVQSVVDQEMWALERGNWDWSLSPP